MNDLKQYLNRLKNPATVLGITGLILNILVLNKINIDSDVIYQTIQSICGILILLGIMNNPETGGVDLPLPMKDKGDKKDVK